MCISDLARLCLNILSSPNAFKDITLLHTHTTHHTHMHMHTHTCTHSHTHRRKSQVFTRDHTAATTIQREWRKKQSTKKQQKFQKETEVAAVNIQNTLRAHIARKQLLEEPPQHSPTLSHSDSDESVAIETIQSSLRGYFARQMAMEDLLK